MALTMGEPAGIGPDITIAAWQALRETGPAFVLVGSAKVLTDRAARLDLDIGLSSVETPAEAVDVFAERLPVIEGEMACPVVAGEPDDANSPAVLSAIEAAVGLVLSGDASAVVTNPIHKAVLYGTGFRFQGHTDFIADLCHRAGLDAEPVMMLSTEGLRTVPITVHIPLKDVPGELSTGSIIRQVRIAYADLRTKFGIAAPRIAVTGLNPHAGENGTIGHEETDIIRPAIDELADTGIDVEGPLPADTVFHSEARCKFDLIVCMYHDQALIPVKTIGFHDGVNTTLGLPLIRTSPDHGTALSLAGTGKANPSSLVAALKLAAQMAERSEQRP